MTPNEYDIADVQKLCNLLDNFRISLPYLVKDDGSSEAATGVTDARDGKWWAEYGRCYLLLKHAYDLARKAQPFLDAHPLLHGLGYEAGVLLGELVRVLKRRNRDDELTWAARWERLGGLADRMLPAPALLRASMRDDASGKEPGEQERAQDQEPWSGKVLASGRAWPVKAVGGPLTGNENAVLTLLQGLAPDASGHPGAMKGPTICRELSRIGIPMGDDELRRVARGLKARGLVGHQRGRGYWATRLPPEQPT